MDTWLGPYIVHKANTKHGYILKTMKGTIMPKVIHGNRMKIYKVPDILFRPTLTTKAIMNHNSHTSDQLNTWVNPDDDQTNQDIQQFMLLLNDQENFNMDSNPNIPFVNQGNHQEILTSNNTSDILNLLEIDEMNTTNQPSVPAIATETEQLNIINKKVAQPTQEFENPLALPIEVINEFQLLAIYEEIHLNIKDYRRKAAKALINTIKQDSALQDLCCHNNRKRGLEAILRANNIDPNMMLSRTPFERVFTKEWRENL